jgi:hypothetical protein
MDLGLVCLILEIWTHDLGYIRVWLLLRTW